MTPKERVDSLAKNACLCNPPVMQAQIACPQCIAVAIMQAEAHVARSVRVYTEENIRVLQRVQEDLDSLVLSVLAEERGAIQAKVRELLAGPVKEHDQGYAAGILSHLTEWIDARGKA